MKKYFQFTETINGLNYFLRGLFTIVLIIPAIIIFLALVGKGVMGSGIDVTDPSAASAIENDPGLALEILMGTFSTVNIIILFIAFLPALWFSLATIYKRLSALQVRFFPGRVKEAFAFVILVELLGIYFMGDSTIIWITGLTGFAIDLFIVFANSNIEDHKG